MSRPQNSCLTLPKLQKLPIGALKLKNDPKIKSKSKVRIEGNMKDKIYVT